MEQIIKTLKEYLKQVIDSDINPSRRLIIQNALSENIHNLEYISNRCKENNIKLGD